MIEKKLPTIYIYGPTDVGIVIDGNIEGSNVYYSFGLASLLEPGLLLPINGKSALQNGNLVGISDNPDYPYKVKNEDSIINVPYIAVLK
jgi:hypothetical protein